MLNRCRARSRAAFAGALGARCPAACGGKGADKAAGRGRRRWCRSRASRRATCRSRCARPSICGRWSRPTSGSKTLGYLDAVLVDRGDRVTRGQLLALVRPSDLPDQLAAARSTLAQAQSSAALARTNFDRAKQLAPEAVVSQQELQQAQSQFATAEAAQQAAAGADRRAGRAPRRDAHRLAADGRGRRSAGSIPGTLVGPAGRRRDRHRRARRHAARVHHRQRARARAASRVGKDAHVEVDALPGQDVHGQGRAARAGAAIRRRGRSTPRCSSTTGAGELYPGMYGRGAIVVETHPQHAGRPGRRGACSSNRQAFAFVVDAAATSSTGARSRWASTAATGSRSRPACAPATRSWSAGSEALSDGHEGPRRARSRPVRRGAAAPRDAAAGAH